MVGYNRPGQNNGDRGWIGIYPCIRVKRGLVKEIPKGEFADPETAQEKFTECASNGARYQGFSSTSNMPICRAIRLCHIDGKGPEDVCPYLETRETVDEPISDGDNNDFYRYFTCTKRKHDGEEEQKQPKGIWNLWGMLPS